MFPARLTEVTAAEVQAVMDNEVAETIDFELKRDLPSKDSTRNNRIGVRKGTQE
jgi:hypothetical protein